MVTSAVAAYISVGRLAMMVFRRLITLKVMVEVGCIMRTARYLRHQSLIDVDIPSEVSHEVVRRLPKRMSR